MGGREGAYGRGETWGHVNKVVTVLLIKFSAVQLHGLFAKYCER